MQHLHQQVKNIVTQHTRVFTVCVGVPPPPTWFPQRVMFSRPFAMIIRLNPPAICACLWPDYGQSPVRINAVSYDVMSYFVGSVKQTMEVKLRIQRTQVNPSQCRFLAYIFPELNNFRLTFLRMRISKGMSMVNTNSDCCT